MPRGALRQHGHEFVSLPDFLADEIEHRPSRFVADA
jgi:hypothetical protein